MSSQLRSNGMGHMEFLLASYRYLKEWKGKDNALAWLTKAIPAQMLNPASMAIFREGQYDLLWDLIRNPEKGEHADFVWLMRAGIAYPSRPD